MVRLQRHVGFPTAADWCLSGRSLSVSELDLAGLATRVVPPGSALEQAHALAEVVAAYPAAARHGILALRQSARKQMTAEYESESRAATNAYMSGPFLERFEGGTL